MTPNGFPDRQSLTDTTFRDFGFHGRLNGLFRSNGTPVCKRV
jgi:hypothetical protein